MSITVISQPSEPSFAYMPCVWVASSNNVDLVRMKCDVYRGDEYDLTNVVATIYQDFDFDSTVFSFDISSIAKDNLTFKLGEIDTSVEVVEDYDGHGWFKCVFTEIVESSTGLLEEGATATSGTRDIYNATGKFSDLVNYNASDYKAAAGSVKRFLTSYQSNKSLSVGASPTRYKEIGLDENEFLGFPISTDTMGFPFDVIEITVLLFNSSFSLLNAYHSTTFTASISTGAGAYTGNYYYVPCGTANLVTSGVNLTDVKYYTVSLTNNSRSYNPSQEVGFKIVDRCEDSVRLHWQNRFGKQDSYTFEGRKIYSMDSKSNNARSVLQNGFISSDKGKYSFNTNTNEVYEVWTRALNVDDLEWISEIKMNNRAFIEIDKQYYAINIEDSNYSIIDNQDVVMQFSLKFTIANNIEGLKG